MEPLDQFERPSQPIEVLDQQKENRTTSFNLLLYTAALIIVGIAFVRSWPSATEIEISELNQRRIELLQTLENSSTEEGRSEIANEYDQLSRQVEQLEAKRDQ